MKANEFVKKFGWRDAVSCIKSCAKPEERWIMHWGSLVADSDFDELKRLVESHELVERIIKDHNKTFADGQIGMPELRRMAFGAGWKRFPKGLKQAIADVESCS